MVKSPTLQSMMEHQEVCSFFVINISTNLQHLPLATRMKGTSLSIISFFLHFFNDYNRYGQIKLVMLHNNFMKNLIAYASVDIYSHKK